MKRRSFIKSLGLMGSSVLVPSMMGGQGLISSASAANVSARSLVGARAIVTDGINYTLPSVLPQVINVFLYGGPSEMAGNLTNIEDISANSQNPYPQNLFPGNGEHTPNGFWTNAGGAVMERMLQKKRLSVYRTINRIDDNSRAHRPSIFSNLTGMIGEDDMRPGVATNIAAFLAANNAIDEEAVFPFVTFEGESVVFNQGSDLPLSYRPISLNQRLENPYQRSTGAVGDSNSIIETLAMSAASTNRVRFQQILSAFTKRAEVDTFVGDLKDKVDNGATLNNPDFVVDSNVASEVDEQITYPGNGFGPRLEKAINLVISNPGTLFVSLGNEGLGGWDDHDSALDRYPGRMQNLMRSLEVAAQHLEAAGKGNVVINVYGDFGRNVNLNNSMGWDHGNCQNLYTVGANPDVTGNGLPGRVLGKIVGETVRKGQSNENRQFTHPTDNSYQCEPFAISASIYKYFGVQNPEILTGGYGAIDETGTENLWVNPNG